VHDPRIKALVISDPGFIFMLGRDELKAVSIPIQLWSSDYGGAGLKRDDVAELGRWLPSPPDHRVVPRSGHWAFLAPCSVDVARAIPRICVDAEGFDRAAFHNAFNADVLGFFRRYLLEGGTQ
jgi:predicted dienelactone hydrolase